MEDYILQHLDLDTRRALGIYKRVKIPDLKIHVPVFRDGLTWVSFNKEKDIGLAWSGVAYIWNFGPKRCSVDRCSMECYNWITGEYITHPDFNSDGTFKNSDNIKSRWKIAFCNTSTT